MQIKIQGELPFKGSVKESRAKRSQSPGTSSRAEEGSFLSVLEEILPSSEAGNRSLQELWSALPETEKEFLNQPSEENLKQYKELVMEITRRTIEKNLRVIKYKKKKPGQEDKELNVVRILDEKLAQMLELIRSPQNSAFALLRQIDEIRGLLYAAQA